MKICNSDSALSNLNELRFVIDFLRQSLCGGRELPFDDLALSGANLIFWSVLDDLKKMEKSFHEHAATQAHTDRR